MSVEQPPADGRQRPPRAPVSADEMLWFVAPYDAEEDEPGGRWMRAAVAGLSPGWPYLEGSIEDDGEFVIEGYRSEATRWTAPAPLPAEAIADDLFEDWVYASAYGNLDGLWDEGDWKEAALPSLKKLDEIRRRAGSFRGVTGDRGLGAWIETAWKRGDPALALALHRHYRPMGHCSMDPGPTLAIRDYLRAALAVGRADAAVALYLHQLHYEWSSRSAWTSWGADAQPKSTGLLALLPVDPERLLRGLVVGLEGVDGGRPSCSAAAMIAIAREAGCVDAFATWLDRLATNERVDLANRLRALLVLIGLVDPATPAGRARLAALSPVPPLFARMRDESLRSPAA